MIVHLAEGTPLLPVGSAADLDRWAGDTAAVTPGNLQGLMEHDSHPHLAVTDTGRSDWHR